MQIEMTTELDIDRPAAELWAVLADYDRDPQWRAGVPAMRAEPRGLVEPGTRTFERMRFTGRTLHNAGEVTTVEPGRRFTWRTTTGADADADGLRSVEPLDTQRCRVRLEQRVRLTGAHTLGAPLARFLLQRRLEADVRRLAAVTASVASRPSPSS